MPKSAKSAATRGASDVIVTAQQSRFHVDATDAPTSKEVRISIVDAIDIKDLSIAVGNKELLVQANLKLRENVHYVLCGRNGAGKSTVMKALSDGSIPGVPRNLRILLLGQSSLASGRVDGNSAITYPEDLSVLSHVLRSDQRREDALAEAKLLSQALENADDPLAIVRSYRELKHDRTLRKHSEALEIATRRSGARGAQARKDLIAVEKEVEESERLLVQPDDEITADAVQSETSEAVELLAEIQASLQASDSDSAERRAISILKGLGFKDDAISSAYSNLSGGWRTRCTLAGALFQKCDILLLDECTNFLDLPAIMWLQSYIQDVTDSTVVVITHDRDFGDAVADELLVLRQQGLEHFNGNLSSYENERRSYTKYMTRMKEAQDGKVKHMEATIASNIAAAKRTGDDKKLKQAAARKKKLEERTGLEVSATGGRFKLSRDRPGFQNSLRAEIEIPKMDPLVKIVLPTIPPSLRFPGALVSMENVIFKYKGKDVPTLKEINLVIHPGQRVGIAGLNGSGKSTLIKLAVGPASDMQNETLMPTSGKVDRHPRLRVKCYSQHSVEELERKAALSPSLTSLQELTSTVDGQAGEGEIRAFLGSLGLPGRLASDVPIASLSGGQKVRLALAKLFYPPPHLLVLDEVTTHLDSDTITALAGALQEYQGALLVVTHDRFFMRTVVEGESPYNQSEDDEDDEDDREDKDWKPPNPGIVYRLINGRLKKLEGGMAEYEGIAERLSKKHQQK